MKKYTILFITVFGIIYSQCDDLLELQCFENTSCNWVENISYGNCSTLAWEDCNNYVGCYVDSNPGWYDNSGPYCTGGTYQIDNSYCLEIEVLECDEMSQLGCANDDSCEWVSDITTGYCGSHNTSSSCPNYPDCSWSCYGCWYLGECCGSYICSGGSYQINNSYCEEVEVLECDEMNQSECNTDDSCDWIEDIEYVNCSNYNNGSTCDSNENCFWDLCYGGSYGSWSHCCRGGTYEIDNSLCEELSFIPGDVNGDGSLNITDIVFIVDFILNLEYNEYSDINQDGILNIIDIIELVNRILDN